MAEKSWVYFICLLEQDGKEYDDYVEGVGADEGSFSVGNDFSVAKAFSTTEELHQWAKSHVVGEYAVHGFYC